MLRLARCVAFSALAVALLTGAVDVHAAALAHAGGGGATPISVDATHAHQPAHFETSELAAHEPCCGCFLRSQWSDAESARDTPWASPRTLVAASRSLPRLSEPADPGRPRAPPVA